MMQVLSGFGDKQLAEIGIERSDIPNYAQRLMSSGQAGECDTSPGTGDISRTIILIAPDAAIGSAQTIPPSAGDKGMPGNAYR